ncbi:MAG TPA: hypothetical protein VKE24_09180 [Candidatus Acidoferrales bacterium]|nr:hypothetical protein [Candidatus Acidoferrales bacterium]
MEDRTLTYKRIAAGSVIGIAIGLVGFYFAETGTKGMGALIFCLFPMTAGFAIGFLARAAKAASASALIALLGSLVLLIAFGKEGPLCALMAFVFLLVTIGIGVLLGIAARVLVKSGRAQNTTAGMFVLVAPVLLFWAKQLEKPLLDRARMETVSTSIWVPDSPDRTWLEIQSIDSIHGAKPWLMYVGLPVPQRCSLEKASVGARRTCYFDKGYIEETVVKWDPPHFMSLQIDRTHMPGRHWLGFEGASYILEPEGKGTRLTRTTVISSHLYPAWYWRPLERLGVKSEHQYLLQDVANRAHETQ